MKTINLLISIVAIATICLFSCERPTPIQASADNDSMKVNCDTIPTEPDTIESDTIEHKDKRYVPSIYLVNQLDKPIDLEMHHNSFPLEFQEELSWYRDANIQNFTLQPNDTVYCDSVVYYMNDAYRYFIFPGENSYNAFVNSYFLVKINYNDNQYEYNDPGSIKNLLRVLNYRYIVFDEQDKNEFNWN